jgi:tryptophan synthase alpha chain
MTPSNRIEDCFVRLRQSNQKGLIAYITAGDPDLETSFALAHTLVEAGVDLLEIGIPFSDPLADGPTIQAASQRALQAGATVPKLLEHLARFRASHDVPLVLFSYLNPLYVFGYEAFHHAAASAGADGLLLLDLPPEEESHHRELQKQAGLRSIRLIAPTTPENRIASIAASAEGFIYYVSREGVTGEQSSLATSIDQQVALIRRHTPLPIAVGFGISTPEQAVTAASSADAAVVGSAIVRRIGEHASDPRLLEIIADFVRPLAHALHSP